MPLNKETKLDLMYNCLHSFKTNQQWNLGAYVHFWPQATCIDKKISKACLFEDLADFIKWIILDPPKNNINCDIYIYIYIYIYIKRLKDVLAETLWVYQWR